MMVKYFVSEQSFINLVQKIKEFVEPRGNKIKFESLSFENFHDVARIYHAVLIYVEISEVHGGPR